LGVTQTVPGGENGKMGKQKSTNNERRQGKEGRNSEQKREPREEGVTTTILLGKLKRRLLIDPELAYKERSIN